MYLCRSPFKPHRQIANANQKMAMMRRRIMNREPFNMDKIPEQPRSLIYEMLKKNPAERISANEILSHPWITIMG